MGVEHTDTLHDESKAAYFLFIVSESLLAAVAVEIKDTTVKLRIRGKNKTN